MVLGRPSLDDIYRIIAEVEFNEELFKGRTEAEYAKDAFKELRGCVVRYSEDRAILEILDREVFINTFRPWLIKHVKQSDIIQSGNQND